MIFTKTLRRLADPQIEIPIIDPRIANPPLTSRAARFLRKLYQVRSSRKAILRNKRETELEEIFEGLTGGDLGRLRALGLEV